jgi:diaminohydroxyphosphoribosylaminopyrimidine deaminase/5-amino-6-(5-phosphoribosylamino)uracil reductase
MTGVCMDDYEKHMRLALELAKKGRTSPNPLVGCVIVKKGKAIGTGYHRRAGLPHAEIEALADAKRKNKSVLGATMCITLEPCCRSYPGKRTPPCTDAILASGISRVVVAMKDPNTKAGGAGIALLRKNGVKIGVGLLENEARELNAPYIKWITKRVPYVAMKMAMSADGKIATRSGDSKWVSGEKSRALVHRMRSEFDAIMVGAGTVKADNPRLTARIKGAHDPIRVIVDSDLCISPDAKFMQNGKGNVIIATTEIAKKQKQGRAAKFESLGAKVLACGKRGVDLRKLMHELGMLGIQSVLMEGGSELNGSAIEAKIVDKIHFFIAPKIVGGKEAKGPVGGKGMERMDSAISLKNMKMEKIGEDFLLSAEL